MSDEPYDHDEWDEEEVESGPAVGVTIEITGLSLYTHHGVSAAEREIGQRLLVDLRFDVGEPDALVTDDINDTIDYGAVCQEVAFVCQRHSVKTLERLAALITEHLIDRFDAEDITIKLAKPEPPLPFVVEAVAIEHWREGS